jgi:uncharacterized protein
VSNIQTGFINNRILKIQVGFLLSEGAGQSRDFEFDVPQALRVADDMMLDYLHGTLHLSRTSRGILVQGTLDTRFDSECARCLDNTLVSLQVPIEELFVYPSEPDAELVVPEDGNLDLAPLLREEIITNTPIGILCKSDCAGLCPNCGQNLNDGPCGCESEDIDPRLAALKALKDHLKD